MVRCPHCEFESESVTAFVYKVGVGDEGHDISGEAFATYLVCPSCDALIGSPNTPDDI